MIRFILLISLVSLSCNIVKQSYSRHISIIDILNTKHRKEVGIKSRSSFQSFDDRVLNGRKEAMMHYALEDDTLKLSSFISINEISFAGGTPLYGEFIVNDSGFYKYKMQTSNSTPESILGNAISSRNKIISSLKAHKFKELEAIAAREGKRLSGSSFYYIGMYEKGMDSIYVGFMPAFMDSNF